MADILEEVLQHLPQSAKIADSCFEGANIILYTKNKEFFLNQSNIIREIVSAIKKRVELRPDPSIVMKLEEAETVITKIIPEEAKVGNLIFDVQRSIVIIEAEKPGVAIGKKGDVLKEIKRQTLWVPSVKRTPSLRSKIIENIRSVLYQNNDYRKKFLHKVGQRIYGGWTKEKRSEWIKLTFLGGGRQVGRSCLYLQTPESKILLDCGINAAASGAKAFPHVDAPDFQLDAIDAIVLTHAHLDHGGFIPYLYKVGYTGPVYCTAPTRDIIALLALDMIDVNFKQSGKALFGATDVREMVKHTICLEYEEVTDIAPDVRITLYNAGHILGSSMAHFHIGNGLHNFVYTGDFKYLRTHLLEPANTKFPRLETVLMEATYGGHGNVLESRKETERKMIEVINKTTSRGGKVLIPVFGVGRSQEMMLLVENAMRSGVMKEVPIYVQGMVWDITAIHTAYPDFLNRNIRKNIFHKDQNPFLSPLLKKVGSKKEQQAVIDGGPCIILATAGMMNAGASLEYFRQLAENPKNTLLFVGYVAEGTVGRKVQDGEREVQVPLREGKPENVKVNLETATFHAFTGHAGRAELMNFVRHLSPRPKKVIVNHGEISRCLDLASSIYKTNRIETIAPANLDAIRLK